MLTGAKGYHSGTSNGAGSPESTPFSYAVKKLHLQDSRNAKVGLPQKAMECNLAIKHIPLPGCEDYAQNTNCFQTPPFRFQPPPALIDEKEICLPQERNLDRLAFSRVENSKTDIYRSGASIDFDPDWRAAAPIAHGYRGAGMIHFFITAAGTSISPYNSGNR